MYSVEDTKYFEDIKSIPLSLSSNSNVAVTAFPDDAALVIAVFCGFTLSIFVIFAVTCWSFTVPNSFLALAHTTQF